MFKKSFFYNLFIFLVCLTFTNCLLAQEIQSQTDKYYYNNFDDGRLGNAFVQIGSIPSLGISTASTNNLTINSGYSLSSIGNSTGGGIQLSLIQPGTNLNDETYGYEWTFLYRNSGGNTDNSDVIDNGKNAWKYVFMAENSSPNASRSYFLTQVGSTLYLRFKYSNSADGSQYNNLISYDLNNIGGNNTTYAIRVQRIKRAGQYVWHLFVDPYTSTIDQASTERGGAGAYEGSLSTYVNSALYSTTTTSGRFKFDEFKMYSMKIQISGANETANGISNPLTAGQQNAAVYGLKIQVRGIFDIYQIQFAVGGDITGILVSGSMYLMRSLDNFYGNGDDYQITDINFYNGNPGYAQKFGFKDRFVGIGNTDGSASTVGYYFLKANVRADASTTASYSFIGAPLLYSESGQINYVDNGSVTNTVSPPVSSGIVYDWQGTTNTVWNVATNWSPNGVPGINDQARIGVVSFGSNQPTVGSGEFKVGNVILGGSKPAVLTVNGTLNISGNLVLNNNANDNNTGTIDGTGTILAANFLVGSKVDGSISSTTANTTILVMNTNTVTLSGAVILNSNSTAIGSGNRVNNSVLQVSNGKILTVNEIKSINAGAANISNLALNSATLKFTGPTPLDNLSDIGKTYISTPVSGTSTIEYASNAPQNVYPNGSYISNNVFTGTPSIGYSNIKFSGTGEKTSVGGTFNIKNAWESNGGKVDLLTNNTVLNFNGATQTITDNGSDGGNGVFLKNMNVSSSGTKTLGGTGKFSITSDGLLSVTGSGSLAAAGRLYLKSDATGTANVGPLTSGSISGDVNVEIYFTGGAGKRGTRMITAPINDNSTTAGNKFLQQIKKSMVVTGPGSDAQGFDPGNNLSPQAVTLTLYNESASTASGAAAQFTRIPSLLNTSVPVITPGLGVFLFYRGDRSNYTPQTATTSSKLLTNYIPESFSPVFVGSLNQGNVSSTITYTNFAGDPNNGYNAVGNPYPATIDWEAVFAANSSILENEIRIVQPGGAIMTRKKVNGVVTVVNAPDPAKAQYIQPGQGFYIKKLNANGNLTFSENQKAVAASPNRLLSSPLAKGLMTNLQMGSDPIALNNSSTNEGNSFKIVLKDGINSDEIAMVFNSGFEDVSDANDVPNLGGSTVNLSSLSSNPVLENGEIASSERGNTINYMSELTDNKTVKLYVAASNPIEPQTIFKGLSLNFTSIAELGRFKAILNDKYLNKQTDLDIEQSYPFDIDRNLPKSFGADRFEITFQQLPKLTTTVSNLIAVQENTQINIEWLTKSEKSSQLFEIEHSVDGNIYTKIGSFKGAGTTNVEHKYTSFDEKPAIGLNFYRIKQVFTDNTFDYSEAISVTYRKPTFSNIDPFTVKQINESFSLDWRTTSEEAVKIFEIERSTDGLKFIKIAEKAAVGNSTIATNYNFIDNSPLKELSYYRIKVVGLNGTFAYSNIRSAQYVYPMDLQNFSVANVNTTIQLKWTTKTEKNSEKFIVQKSVDGNIFTDLSTIAAAGNSITAKNYEYIDSAPEVGSNYYRLILDYTNETSSISEIKSINYLKPNFNLVTFTGVKNSNTIVLKWTTSSELASKLYEIERSIDGRNFNKIGEILGGGTNNGVKDYQFVDVNPIVGNIYYRVKQIYTDNTYGLSNLIAVNYENPLTASFNYFEALKDVLGVKLNWSANVVSTDYIFEVERSADGNAFLKIGENFSNTNSVNTFIDTKPIPGINYYRIKAVNKYNEFSLSVIRSVNFYVVEQGEAVKNLKVFPNPSSDFIEVGIDNVGSNLTIYNIGGLPVKSVKFGVGDVIKIPINELSNGLYFLELRNRSNNKLIGSTKFFKN